MNKRELLDELETSRERFLEQIEDIQDDAYEEPGVNGTWSLKDVLAHLTRWEAELVKLLWQVSQGQAPTSAHFSGISTDKLNEKWYNEMRTRRLEMVLEDYHNVRNQTMRRVEDFSDQELVDPKHYRWLGGKPLWTWVAADSYEHEYEHFLQVKAWRERRSDG
jgi:hypothetical protein